MNPTAIPPHTIDPRSLNGHHIGKVITFVAVLAGGLRGTITAELRGVSHEASASYVDVVPVPLDEEEGDVGGPRYDVSSLTLAPKDVTIHE